MALGCWARARLQRKRPFAPRVRLTRRTERKSRRPETTMIPPIQVYVVRDASGPIRFPLLLRSSLPTSHNVGCPFASLPARGSANLRLATSCLLACFYMIKNLFGCYSFSFPVGRARYSKSSKQSSILNVHRRNKRSILVFETEAVKYYSGGPCFAFSCGLSMERLKFKLVSAILHSTKSLW